MAQGARRSRGEAFVLALAGTWARDATAIPDLNPQQRVDHLTDLTI